MCQQYGPSLRTRIVIISRHVRSRGVDELKMLLLMPQKFSSPSQQRVLSARYSTIENLTQVSSKLRILSVGMLNFWGIRSSIWIQTRV